MPERTSNSSGLIWESWQRNAEARPEKDAIRYWGIEGETARITWGDLYADACKWAALLPALGVAPGDVCATIIPNQPRFAALYMGIVLCGAVPAVLASPNPRLHPEKFRFGLSGMLEHSGFDWLLADRSLEEMLQPLVDARADSFKGMIYPLELELPPSATAAGARTVSAEDPCLLQHSSGTTGLQKPVMLSHRAVGGHLDTYAETIRLTPDDCIVSWLPIYHDMGLITSFHMPLRFGLTLIQLDPVEWVKAPISLLEAIAANRCTLTWLPNFAYNLMAQRVDDDERKRLSLGSMRMFVNCSEPVRAASHGLFADALTPAGLNPAALTASYAMAEATFAVTQTAPGARARVVRASHPEFAKGTIVDAAPGEPARLCTSSGIALPGCRVEIRDEKGAVLGENVIGELFVSSPSLFSGYRNRPEASAAVLADGWYKTGDRGFSRDGELYVIGRQKDIIIVAGKNLYPEDIEDTVSGVAGILPGRVVALGVENADKGTEEIYVVAETAISGDAERRQLKVAVLRAGIGIDITIRDVVLIEPRQLIKSSAGKPARAANRIYLPQAAAGAAP